MDASVDELKALLDREKIRDRIALLARGEDRRDAALLRSCYWPDAAFRYGARSGTFRDYLTWVIPGGEAITNTQHILAQSLIELDGDAATTETHVIAYHRVDLGDAEHDTMIGGRYLDRLERRAVEGGRDEWRIVHRTMIHDWYQDWGAALDGAQVMMGYAFSGLHHAGRANGDRSEAF